MYDLQGRRQSRRCGTFKTSSRHQQLFTLRSRDFCMVAYFRPSEQVSQGCQLLPSQLMPYQNQSRPSVVYYYKMYVHIVVPGYLDARITCHLKKVTHVFTYPRWFTRSPYSVAFPTVGSTLDQYILRYTGVYDRCFRCQLPVTVNCGRCTDFPKNHGSAWLYQHRSRPHCTRYLYILVHRCEDNETIGQWVGDRLHLCWEEGIILQTRPSVSSLLYLVHATIDFTLCPFYDWCIPEFSRSAF